MSSLLGTLVLYNYDKEAALLQMKMQHLLTKIEESITEIWDPDLQKDTTAPVRPLLSFSFKLVQFLAVPI